MSGNRNAAIASECRRVGERYYAQISKEMVSDRATPDRAIHSPGAAARASISFARHFTVRGILERPLREWCRDFFEPTPLLTVPEMRLLFPDGQMWRERLAGLNQVDHRREALINHS